MVRRARSFEIRDMPLPFGSPDAPNDRYFCRQAVSADGELRSP
jgi:hypothetical protein